MKLNQFRDYNGYLCLKFGTKILCKHPKIKKFLMDEASLIQLERILVICGNCSKYNDKELTITKYEEQVLKQL